MENTVGDSLWRQRLSAVLQGGRRPCAPVGGYRHLRGLLISSEPADEGTGRPSCAGRGPKTHSPAGTLVGRQVGPHWYAFRAMIAAVVVRLAEKSIPGLEMRSRRAFAGSICRTSPAVTSRRTAEHPCAIVWLNPLSAKNGHQHRHQNADSPSLHWVDRLGVRFGVHSSIKRGRFGGFQRL